VTAPPVASGRRGPPIDPRLLRHARSARGFLALTVALGLVTAVTVIAQAELLATVIAGAFTDGRDLAGLATPLLALLGVVGVRAGVAWATEVAAHRSAAGVRGELRRRLLRRVVAEGPVARSGDQRGALAVSATRGLEALDAFFSRYLPQLALAVLVPLLAIAWIWPRDLLTVGLLAVTLPVIPVFMALIGKMAGRHVARQWSSLQQLGGHFVDVMAGLTTLKTVGAARRQRERVEAITDRFRASTMRTLRVAFLSAGWLELMAMIGTAMIAVGIGLRLVEGTLDLQTGLAILILVPEVYLPVRNLGQQFHAAREGMESAAELLDVIDADDDAPAATGDASGEDEGVSEAAASLGARAREAPHAPAHPAGHAPIRLDAVHYAYPRRPEGALHGLDLAITPGERLAVIGPTGAGKSTLLALLLGFAAPQQGAITVPAEPDGTPRPLTALDLRAWRASLAWVPQRPHLVAGTIADNLRLARPEATSAQVAEAGARAGLDDVVAALPAGYDSDVGEDGQRLSAGQRRRVALARAWLRQASLVLLDEPTADLDPASEAHVVEAIDGLARDRTVVAVTHRLALAERADRVAVIADGRVVQQGAPSTLASLPGPYRAIAEADPEALRGLGWVT